MHALRIALRVAVLLLLSATAVALVALSGEYPGSSGAGRHVAMRELLPLALLAWAHLGMLDAPKRRAFWRWAAIAALGDSVLLASGIVRARPGGAPLALALPVIAMLLLVGTIGVARRGDPAVDLGAAS